MVGESSYTHIVIYVLEQYVFDWYFFYPKAFDREILDLLYVSRANIIIAQFILCTI